MDRIDLQVYLQMMRSVQDSILAFIEKPNINEEDFHHLKIFLKNQNFPTDRYELKTFLYLILYISNNHHRTTNFIIRIKQIILIFKEEIKKYYTNNEIFNIFKGNKFILFLLFQEKLIILNSYIESVLTSDANKNNSYKYFFYNELKKSLKRDFCSKIESILKTELNTNSMRTVQAFCDKNRQIGENDLQICQLIREDSLNKFKEYVKESNTSLSKKVKLSIFETNNFLINNTPNLIEYSSFFGSIEIFKYLLSNQIELTSSLWLYAIHSNKMELIQLLEENNVSPPKNDFKECLLESIKCHHQNITNYILSKYFENISDIKEKILPQAFKFFNFFYQPNENSDFIPFFNSLCKSDYYTIVNALLQSNEIDLNAKRIIKKTLFFYLISNKKIFNEIFAKFFFSNVVSIFYVLLM